MTDASHGVIRTDRAGIQAFRELFLREASFQVRYNACHERGWTDSYVPTVGDVDVGYGPIKGRGAADRDVSPRTNECG